MELTKDDTWVILSPTRTGSKTLVYCIEQSYSVSSIRLNLYFPEDKPTGKLPYKSIWHSHTHEILNHLNDKTKVVLSVRDPKEIALSVCIVEHFKHWHIQRSNLKLVSQTKKSVPKYKIDPDKFVFQFREILMWYNVPINRNYIKVDYNDFKDDVHGIYGILDIPAPPYTFLPIVQNPAPLKDWVENWDEISEIYNDLPNFPY